MSDKNNTCKITGELRGLHLLDSGTYNKSTAFTAQERERFGLRGLLPHKINTQDMHQTRALGNLRRKAYDIEKYIFLSALQDRNEKLFYRLIIENVDEIMPLIYTPTVGQACKEFAHIYRRPKGFYITPDDKGQIRSMLDNWPEDDVKVTVVTDGQRILGLGDLGSNGMGIPIGKLALYTACAGIHPHECLPVMLDVGTNNEELLNDPLYMGYPHKRLEGQAYLDLVEEFISAIQDKYPDSLLQFEDFLTPNAYKLLETYRDKILCFNDDIQGTAAVALSGVIASNRITGHKFSDLRIMFLGAGSAATGIGDLLLAAFMEEGLSHEDAVKRLWFVDQHGIIVKDRDDLMSHNIPYAHDYEQLGFVDAINAIKPHILIGATGAPGTFTQEVIETMSKINKRPAIFALSNPTSRAECTAEQAYEWSNGQAIFTSGSPFGPVELNGKTHQSGQGNNAYVFPGIGLGAVACKAKMIDDKMFLASAQALALQVSQANLDAGTLYPPLADIREVSLAIAIAVAQQAYKSGLAQLEEPLEGAADLKAHIEALMYQPYY